MSLSLLGPPDYVSNASGYTPRICNTGDGDSDSALYSLLVLLLFPIGLAAFVVYHDGKRKVPGAPLYFGPQLPPTPAPALYASPIPLSSVPPPPPESASPPPPPPPGPASIGVLP